MRTMISVFLLVIFTGVISSGQQGLKVGDKAPLFRAASDDGSTWDISKFLGRKFIVVYFYPAAMTGGCTKQACAYRDHKDDLQAAETEVVGISGDKIESLKLFKQAENLNFTLLSDDKGDIAKAFGVPLGDGGSIKRSVGGTEHDLSRGVTARRWTFIVGKDGRIIYRNDAVNAETDTEEVLDFIRKQKAE